MIKDHPWIGKQVRYGNEKEKEGGVITGVRTMRGAMFDEKTKTLRVGYELRIKPDTGGPTFWISNVFEPQGKEEDVKPIREEVQSGT